MKENKEVLIDLVLISVFTAPLFFMSDWLFNQEAYKAIPVLMLFMYVPVQATKWITKKLNK